MHPLLIAFLIVAVVWALLVLTLGWLALAALNYNARRIAAALESIGASARLLAGLTVDEVTRPVDRVGELTKRARMSKN